MNSFSITSQVNQFPISINFAFIIFQVYLLSPIPYCLFSLATIIFHLELSNYFPNGAVFPSIAFPKLPNKKSDPALCWLYTSRGSLEIKP